MAESTEISSEDLAQIHAPSQAVCRLLTHRFKPTKMDGESRGKTPVNVKERLAGATPSGGNNGN
jgi:hypothetical protein